MIAILLSLATAVLAIFACCAASNAADWVFLGIDGIGNECFYDRESLVRTDNGLKVWERVGPDTLYVEMNCLTRERKLLKWVRPGKTHTYSPDEPWEGLVPGCVGELLRSAACRDKEVTQ